MLLIAGLGNPGRRYSGNRHNIGFMALDAIHRRHGFAPWRARFEGETSEGHLGTEKALLLKPATYMNESGRSVGQALKFYKLDLADLLVIYDELDLPPGKLRMRRGGSSAGHRGLKSIEAHAGREFRRMRIGIGHPGARELVNGYVLHDFARADEDWLAPLLGTIADNAPLLAGSDDGTFMNRIHLATPGNEDAPAPARGKAKADTPAPDTIAGADRPAASHHTGTPAGGAFANLKKLFGRD